MYTNSTCSSINKQSVIYPREVPRFSSNLNVDPSTITSIYARTLLDNLSPEKGNRICMYTPPRNGHSESIFSPNCTIPARTRKPPISSPFKNIKGPDLVVSTDLDDDFYSNPVTFNETSLISFFQDKFSYIPDVNEPEVHQFKDLWVTTPTAVSLLGTGEVLIAKKLRLNRSALIKADIEYGGVEAKEEMQTNEPTINRILPFDTNRVAAITWKQAITQTKGSIMFIDFREEKPDVIYNNNKRICAITKPYAAGSYIYATGHNDNIVKVWDIRSNSSPTCEITHAAAVRGMAFNPINSNLLATGGGISDRTIKITNIDTKETLIEYPIESQVCNLDWHANGEFLIAGMGFYFPSITIFKLNRNRTLVKQATFWNAHNHRSIYSANQQPIRNYYVSAGRNNENDSLSEIKFWSFFSNLQENTSSRNHRGSLRVSLIR